MIDEYTETSTTPDWSKSYVYAGSRLLSTITKNGGSELTEYHHPDRLGTKAVSDTNLNTFKEQATLPFGALIDAETTASTNQKFTSYDRSGATGLDYAVNRTYNPGQSRFTQVDPIGMASTSIGNPQSLNMFAYTQNNPVDFVDPTGTNLSAGCYVYTTGYMFEDGTTVNVTTTYFCIVGSGGGGFASPGSWGGGGGGGHEGEHQKPQETACGRMANRLERLINRQLGLLGGAENITTHQQLNTLLQNINSIFTEFYVGKETTDSKGATPPPPPDGGASGFRTEYIDSEEPNEDQTHHFAGYFNAGINRSYFKAFAHKWGTDMYNTGDKELGDIAYSMGESLNMRMIRRTVIDRTNARFPVRRTVSIPEAIRNRLQRIMDIANRIRNEICQSN